MAASLIHTRVGGRNWTSSQIKLGAAFCRESGARSSLVQMGGASHYDTGSEELLQGTAIRLECVAIRLSYPSGDLGHCERLKMDETLIRINVGYSRMRKLHLVGDGQPWPNR